MFLTNKKKIWNNDCIWALLVATAVAVIAFLPFLGQYLFSDFVSFAKAGDQHNGCYPSFVHLGRLLSNGIFYGTDTVTFNGASEFFLRPGLPTFYAPNMLAALLGAVLNKPYFFYILFYVIHFIVCLYFAIRLVQRFFGLNRHIALLYIGTCLLYLLGNMWYNSFAIISQLVFPALYFSMISIDGYRKREALLLAFPIVLAFTSGYIVLSVALVIFSYFITISYIVTFRKDIPLRKSIKNVTMLYIVAGGVSFLYCFNLLIYVKKVVQSDGMTLSIATASDVDVRNLINMFLLSFISINGREGSGLVFLGIPWAVFLALSFFDKFSFILNNAQRKFIKWNIVITIFLVAVTWGLETSISTWFYALFPILGAMHLPGRYFMITFPTCYLSFCMLIQNIENKETKRNRWYLYACITLLLFAGMVSVLSTYVAIPWIHVELFVLELIVSAIVIRYVYLYGWNGCKTLLVWGGVLAILATTRFNSLNSIGASELDAKRESISYNVEDQQRLQDYIASLDAKYLYRYMCFSDTNIVTPYIQQNYPWRNDGKYRISNYLGYDLHSGIAKDYTEHFGWFDAGSVSWEYVANTRGDFIVVDQAVIDKYYDQWNILVDWSKSEVLSNGMQILRLKKFIPSFFNEGVYYQEDIIKDQLDNGYMYSPDIKNYNVKSFATDGSTYFDITVSVNEDAYIAFLPYDNRNYKYYLDGVEFLPEKHEIQTYWKIPEGEHECEIVYKDTLVTASNISLLLYYIGVLISAIACFLIKRKQAH